MKRGPPPDASAPRLVVWKASGEELAAIPVEDLEDVKSLKKYLRRLCGLPRFRQRLLNGGKELRDEDKLNSAIDVQLVLLPYIHAEQREIDVLVDLALQGWRGQMEEMLQKPMDPNGISSVEEVTALVGAVHSGHLDIVDLLIEAGSDVNMLDAMGRTSLSVAAEFGDLEIVRVLLQAGASTDATTFEGRTPLARAAEHGKFETARFLMEARANVHLADVDGKTAFHAAGRNGHLGIVQLLADAGASKDAVDRNGWPPLTWAAAYGHTEVVRLLLNLRSDINVAGNRGGTPLFWASSNGKLETVKLLIESGAEKDLEDLDGDNALRAAASNVRKETVRYLLEVGCKVKADMQGFSNPRFVSKRGQMETWQMLKDALVNNSAAESRGSASGADLTSLCEARPTGAASPRAQNAEKKQP